MRISTSQIFSQALINMNSSLNDVTELNMMTSTQKRINRPSDDPAGMGKVMELSAYDQSLSGYLDNCGTSTDILNQADQALLIASENITAATELAEQGATETYTAGQLQMMALEMEGYMDSLFTIANTESGTDSLFSGDDLGSNAYEMSIGVTLPNNTLSNAAFAGFDGELTSNVAVRFDDDGTIGSDALDYSYSTDYGETWITATLAAGDTTITASGVDVEFVTGTGVTAADGEGNGTEFYLRETAYYTGSADPMSVAISENTSVEMTTVGSDVFGGVNPATNVPYGEPNLFETLSDCIVYLELGDHDAVAACLEDLRSAHETVEAGAANLGARENKVTFTDQALSQVQSLTANSISREEDADAAQLIVELEQANYVYEAVLSSSADVMRMSLLNYI